MIDFVLEDARDEPSRAQPDALTRHERPVHGHPERAAHGRDDAWNTQAAFLGDRGAGSAAYPRIQEREESAAGVGEDYAQRHADLDRGEPDTVCVPHGYRHVGD